MAVVPPNALFSALSFIGSILAAIPLLWHLQSWNTGTCLYMLWTSIGCLMLFVNSIVWSNNVINWAPVWCDISSHYLIGASIGIPASSLCITRRLYYMLNGRPITTKKNKWRREILVDLLIGIGLPFLVMGLEYIVQGQRFLLFEEFGCFPAIYITIPTYFILYMWPLLIGLISMFYAVLTFRRALQQKARLEKMLSAKCSISTGQYWRLMALCATQIVFAVPMSIYSIITNTLSAPPVPYNWTEIHTDFSAIPQYPSVVWKGVPLLAAGVEITRWSFVLCAFVIFGFFGWSMEARDRYRRVYRYIGRLLGYSGSQSLDSLASASTKPQDSRPFANNHSSPLYVDYKINLEEPSTPIQARVKYRSYLSLTTVDVENLSEFVSTGHETNWPGSPNPESPTLGSEDYRHVSLTASLDMPMSPPPAFTGHRRQSLLAVSPT